MADEKILKDKGLKDEKILKDELLSDEQLEQVAGGKTCKMFEQNPNTANDSNLLSNSMLSWWTIY